MLSHQVKAAILSRLSVTPVHAAPPCRRSLAPHHALTIGTSAMLVVHDGDRISDRSAFDISLRRGLFLVRGNEAFICAPTDQIRGWMVVDINTELTVPGDIRAND